MTSKLTREELLNIIETDHVQCGEASALARIALAAMDSEPAAWTWQYREQWHVTSDPRRAEFVAKDGDVAVLPLYRHAQQPVVEREPIAWLNDAYLARGVVDGEAGSEDAGPGYIPVYREAGPHPAPVVPDERDKAVDADDHPLLWSFNAGWNASRAAMLAAAQQSPGSEPATVPGKWIPVSERMPEMGEKQRYVLAADFKNNYWPNIPNTQVGVYGDWFDDGNPTWDDGDGEDLHLKEVTHWMPLPAAPQEGK